MKNTLTTIGHYIKDYLLMILIFSLCPAALGYEVATHGQLTLKSFERSALFAEDRQLLRDLGILYLTVLDAFGQTFDDIPYYHVRPGQPGIPRFCNRALETNVINRMIPNPDARLSIRGWMVCGVVREDDYSRPFRPHDDPWRPYYFRVFNHFFDPYFNRPLGGPVLTTLIQSLNGEPAKRSPDWVTGYQDAFAAQPVPDANRTNVFSILDAREAMYRALTGRGPDGPYNEAIRKSYWATTFRALGGVIHHIQDMAQPQHTRNEPHSGVGGFLIEALVTGHASAMEKHMECRTLDETRWDTRTQVDRQCTAFDFDQPSWQYPIPQFNRYSDFWSTSPGPASLTGKGLADYSSRGFFTEAKDFGHTEYPSPSSNPNDYTEVEETLDGRRITFLRGNVRDTYRGGQDTIRITSLSLFYDPQDPNSQEHLLNTRNMDDHVSLLFPRAVAYGSGLLNYFFRGRMEISLPDEGVYGIVDQAVQYEPDVHGFRKIKLKLRNITPAITPPGAAPIPQTMSGGKLIAVAKYHKNLCYVQDLSLEYEIDAAFAYENCRDSEERIVTSVQVRDSQDRDITNQNVGLTGTPQLFSFIFNPPIPINSQDLYLQVVYRGELGSEADAVVVATQDVSEPTHFSVLNATDYLLCIRRDLAFQRSKWRNSRASASAYRGGDRPAGEEIQLGQAGLRAQSRASASERARQA